MKGVENANIISKGATDRRLALILLDTKVTLKFVRTGRLFLCLIIALRANGIIKSKASDA